MSFGVVLGVVGLATTGYGMYKSGKDQKEAAEDNATYAKLEGESRREIANFNSEILAAHALRIRNTQISRVKNQGIQIAQRGVEEENKVRQNTAQVISSQRAAAGARNIAIDIGTPAALQIDTARMGEVDALRVRRNHRLEQEAVAQQVSDLEFEAADFDKQAALAILTGDAELAAGLNRANAYNKAGQNAYTAGILSGVGNVAAGIDPKWFERTPA